MIAWYTLSAHSQELWGRGWKFVDTVPYYHSVHYRIVVRCSSASEDGSVVAVIGRH